MRIRPTGNELLSTARTVLRDNVLPHVPAEALPAASAIGRAMALAAEELDDRCPARSETLDALESARTTLREKLLACLPKEHQYDARLVAKAIVIVTRELRNGDDPERQELTRLLTLMDVPPSPAGDGPGVREQLEGHYSRLGVEIRRGRIDPGTPASAAIYAHLRDMNRQALSESHPEYLESHGPGAREPRTTP